VLTTSAVDCLIVNIVTTGTDVASTTMVTGWTNAGFANPSITEQADNWTASGTGGGFAAAAGGRAAQGLIAATTATLTTGNFKALLTIAFQGQSAILAEARTLMRSPRPMEQGNVAGPYAPPANSSQFFSGG
jgi:hypothetical protein